MQFYFDLIVSTSAGRPCRRPQLLQDPPKIEFSCKIFAFVFAFECGSRAANGERSEGCAGCGVHESFIFAAVDDDSSIDLH